MQSAVERTARCSILYDCQRLTQAPADWFDPRRLRAAGLIRGEATGRGAAWLFEADGQGMVLRHYRRGGAIARLLGDRYLGLRLAASRAWREWHLLARLWDAGLPVPRPVAARVCRCPPFYRCDLITALIDGAESLADRMLAGRVSATDWRAVGATLWHFHARGVRHADLNARNLLFDATDRVHLIDFDRGRIEPGTGRWRRDNLDRLHRSLRKIGDPVGAFDPAGWQQLERGYRDAG